MNNQLSDLIAYYEEEKNRLLDLLNDYITESDYIAAHHHSMALAKVNYQLNIFYHLQDKAYSGKANLLGIIDSYEKQIESGISEFERNYYLKIIQKEREKLDKLRQSELSLDHIEHQDLLDSTLFKLIDKRIKYFNLILIKKKNFYLNFRLSKKQFVISLDNIKRHVKKHALYEGQINSLERSGFIFSSNRNKLTLFLPYAGSKDINSVKLILIKIVFEIFHFSEFENESYIEYKEHT